MRHLLLLLMTLAALPAAAQLEYDRHALEELITAEKGRGIAPRLRSGGPPTRGFDMKYLRCAWTLDPAVHYISGTVTSWFAATQPIDQVTFDLSDNLAVNSVTMHGNALTYTHTAQGLLIVDLPGTLDSGQLDSLTISYQGAPPNTGFGSFITDEHQGDPVLWTLSEPYGAKDWWPCKDDLNDKIDSLDCFVTTPLGQRAAGHGLLVGADTTGNQVTWHWRHRYPIDTYLVAVAVTNYQVDEQYAQLANDSLLMLTYAYPEDLPGAAAAATELLPVITLFDSLFGAYPFANEKYGHAQFGWGGGMEHQTMSFMGTFHPEIMSHELAHQWFGDKVTCGSWEDIWLNEGFATYLSGLDYEFLGPVYWPGWKQGKVDHITSLPDGSVFCDDTSTTDRIFSSRLTYSKGAMVLHMLRWVCGDSAFFQGVRNYLNDPGLAYGTALTDDLKGHLEASSGLDLTGFFADWYTGQGYPSYTVIWSQGPGGTVSVNLSQTTSHPSVDFFEMPVPVRFSGGGQDSTVVLQHTANDQEFTFDLPFTVEQVVFDPEIWLVSAQNLVTRVAELAGGRELLRLRPNPATDRIQWQGGSAWANSSAVLRDAMGRAVRQVAARTGSMDLAGLAPGQYTLEMITALGPMRARFIKEQ
ncbi:MAG: peptidase M1 [Flavobacteriales bacterium]|nr:peptidase M1 [Flavobacteriales bacterium]